MNIKKIHEFFQNIGKAYLKGNPSVIKIEGNPRKHHGIYCDKYMWCSESFIPSEPKTKLKNDDFFFISVQNNSLEAVEVSFTVETAKKKIELNEMDSNGIAKGELIGFPYDSNGIGHPDFYRSKISICKSNYSPNDMIKAKFDERSDHKTTKTAGQIAFYEFE